MKDINEYINESLICEAVRIDNESSPEFDAFMEYVWKYSKSLKIQNQERQRYEKKGTPITQEIAQDLLSKRLYNNVSVRYTTDPEFFLAICNKHNVTVNMSNLGFGKGEVIKWDIPVKKMNPKDIYFDDIDIVWYDKTIGFRHNNGGVEILPEYVDRVEEILSILKKKYKYVDWHLIKK